MEIYEFSQIEHQLAPVFERHGCEAEQITANSSRCAGDLLFYS